MKKHRSFLVFLSTKPVFIMGLALLFIVTPMAAVQAIGNLQPAYSESTAPLPAAAQAVFPPLANPDSYTALVDLALDIPAPGVLENDVQLSPTHTLTASLVSPPIAGELLLNPDGGFRYTPPISYTGEITFTYWVTDGRQLPTGNFGAGFDFAKTGCPSFLRAIALGDLDGDGDLDLAVACQETEGLLLYFNDGSGWLNSPVHPPVPGAPTQLALGDMDGDSDLDIVWIDYNNFYLKIARNIGGGNYSTWQSQSIGDFGQIALADVDHDDDLDILVNTWQGVLLSKNDHVGGMAYAQVVIPTSQGSRLSMGDVDGDGDPDAVVNTGGNARQVWLNDGTGAFGSTPAYVQTLPSGSYPYDCRLVDLDGDGDLDMVSIDGKAARVWLNNGAGNFGSSPAFILPTQLSSLLDLDVADLDQDGDEDIVLFPYNAADPAGEVFLNDGQAGFGLAPAYPAAKGTVIGGRLGDMNGDGIPDAVTGLYQKTNGIQVFLNPIEPLRSNTAQVRILVQPTSADSGFRPSLDGYHFANYRLEQADLYQAGSLDLLIDLFGADFVCQAGTYDGATCTPDLHMLALVSGLSGGSSGQAYGMAVTSMRFYLGKDTFQQAGFTQGIIHLEPRSPAVETHLLRYTLQQITQPVAGSAGWERGLNAWQMVSRLLQALSADPAAMDPYLLLLYTPDGDAGYPLLPYRITRLADRLYAVWVYDPNLPLDDERQVIIDTLNGTWSYLSHQPSGYGIVLNGANSTGQFDLRRLSGHQSSGLTLIGAPASGDMQAPASLFITGDPLAIVSANCFSASSIDVQVDMAPDANGHCSQRPFASGPIQCLRLANGGSAQGDAAPIVCGLGDTSGSMQSFLNVQLFDNNGLQNMTLLSTSGSLVSFQAVDSPASAFSVSPDGSSLYYKTGAQAPGAIAWTMVARALSPAQPSISVSISNVSPSPEALLDLQLDESAGRFEILTTSTSPLTFTLTLERLNASGGDGNKDVFVNTAVVLGGQTHLHGALVDFSAWQGSGRPLDFYLDMDGDGFADETRQSLRNQFGFKNLFLPLVTRPTPGP